MDLRIQDVFFVSRLFKRGLERPTECRGHGDREKMPMLFIDGRSCHTCAKRMPVTIASWCSVPKAPLRLVGAISPTYIGVKPDANPASKEELRKQEIVKPLIKWTH